MALEKTDFTDPICPFDTSAWTGEPAETIPVNRIMEKADDLVARNDMKGAERFYKYWLDSAKAFRDIRGAFFIHNELIGLYRKTGDEEKALKEIAEAFSLTEDERIGKASTGAATLCLNAATAYKAFDHSDKALPLFERAQNIYERDLTPGDEKLGGLYNNMALALADLEEWDRAEEYFFKAIDIMKQVKDGELDAAISYLNLADIQPEDDPAIEKYLDEAERLLNTETLPRNSYYAFVADRCAPVFEGYGRKAYADELIRRKEAIL